MFPSYDIVWPQLLIGFLQISMPFNTQIKLFVTIYMRNNKFSENTLQVWVTLNEQSDQC